MSADPITNLPQAQTLFKSQICSKIINRREERGTPCVVKKKETKETPYIIH